MILEEYLKARQGELAVEISKLAAQIAVQTVGLNDARVRLNMLSGAKLEVEDALKELAKS